MLKLVRTLTRLGSFECLFGLDREAERNFRRPVENLKEMIAEQATELALGPGSGCQFDPAISGLAFGTGDVGFPHWPIMPCGLSVFQCRQLRRPYFAGLPRLAKTMP